MLGILKFQTFLLVVLLFICSCSYLHGVFPSWLDRNKTGYTLHIFRTDVLSTNDMRSPLSTFWRAARIGERLSPYVSLCCVAMAVSPFRLQLSELC